MRNRSFAAGMTKIALGAALLCIVSPFTVSLSGAVPLSLASFFVILLSALFAPFQGAVCVLLYLALGALGLPLFSGARGGVGVLFGATGGYLFGFLLLALFAGIPCKKPWRRALCVFFGTAALYAVGTAWYCFVTKNPPAAALGVCILPFLPGDFLKAAAALAVFRILKKRGVFI